MPVSVHYEGKYKLVARSDALDEAVLQYEKGLDNQAFFEAFFDVKDGARLGYWYMSPMPGCCGVVVSHGLVMEASFRGNGYSKAFMALRFEVAKKLGYSAMVATALTSNFPEIISSAKAGWKLGPVFRNKRTTRDVAFQIKLL
jgi:GNAT superfamily N-acetyltransferase